MIITNAEEALGIAIQIETNGTEFYRAAAELHKSEDDAKELLRLASMEDDHRKAFERMRTQLKAREPATGAHQSFHYLQAMADAHGGEGDPLTAELLAGDESLEEILNTAVRLEERSILFYSGLKDVVGEQAAQATIDRILAEERAHVVALEMRLDVLR